MADSDEEDRERFDVENDYEGGTWINGEFYFNNKRQKRAQTRDDQLYGVFGDSDDEDEGRRRKKGDGGGTEKDFSRPVNFVSTGIVGGTAGDRDKAARGMGNAGAQGYDRAQMDVGEDGEEEDEEDARPIMGQARGAATVTASRSSGAGLGGGGSAGLGHSSSAAAKAAAPLHDDDDTEVLPSAFGRRIKERAAARLADDDARARRSSSSASAASAAAAAAGGSGGFAAAGRPGRGGAVKKDADFASFEKHTKGIGMRLMQKMGYTAGEGLGSGAKKGIVEPVLARARVKNMGLGVGSRDTATAMPGFGAPAAPEPDAAAAAKKLARAAASAGGAPRLWKKKAAPVRNQRTYKTASEVLEEVAERPVQSAPILDMRGPTARLITNMDQLNSGSAAVAARVPMPELQHNLALLVDLTEARLQRLDASLRQSQDTATLLARDKTRLAEEVSRGSSRLLRAQALSKHLTSAQAKPPSTSLGQLAAMYSTLHDQFKEEYALYGIASAAVAQVLPRMQSLMSGWTPLSDPHRGLSEFTTWRPLLTNASAANPLFQQQHPPPSHPSSSPSPPSPTDQDPFRLLLEEVLLPPLRTSITMLWEPREPEPLLSFLDAWTPLLPAPTLQMLLHMLVLPKIRSAVGAWNPTQETIPIHAWIHPWLPTLSSQLQEVYPALRERLESALSQWLPSDGSAAALLGPWCKVFEGREWEGLLQRSIVPKLAGALASLDINPAAQVLDPFNWVMAWSELLPQSQMVGLLEAGFFPRWHQVLHHWLSHGSADYDEVTRWYLGWKSLLPPSLVDTPRIRNQLNYALNLMNAAVEGGAMPPYPGGPGGAAAGGGGAGAAAPPLPSDPSSSGYAQHVVNMGGGMGATLTLRDLVARYAEEAGVKFMPKAGRFHDGLQVYGFGSVSVVCDNTAHVVRAQLRERWAPVSLEMLAQQNVARAGSM
ncbi:MAG: hypothetical protein WDW38_001866 [Sanguina aurantia]